MSDLVIATWNCNGAFRKKFEALMQFKADILVIQECEDPEVTKDIGYKSFAQNYLVGPEQPCFEQQGCFHSERSCLI